MGRASNTPTKLLAYDEFLQTEGALTGKTPGLGSNWAGAGDTDDFTVIAASDLIQRTAVSDTAALGRFCTIGETNYETAQVSITVAAATQMRVNETSTGVLARYSGTTKWVRATVSPWAGGPEGDGIYLGILRNSSGTVASLGSWKVGWMPPGKVSGNQISLTSDYEISLSVNRAGICIVECNGVRYETSPDSYLSFEGALATGRWGVYDESRSASAATRLMTGFRLIAADNPAVVCYAGRSIAFTSQGVVRESEDGKTWGQPDLPRGGNFYLEPEGADGRINRVVVLMRRNDVEVEPDSHVTDKHTVEVKVRERFLLPR